ncbi:MAG TPA: Fic family protein [Thermoanaerobaculia bacterium]
MLFRTPVLNTRELEVLHHITELKVTLKYATSEPVRWTGLLRRNAFARAVRGSNSIEGYNVTMEDAIAAVEGEEPMDPRTEAWMAVAGYRRALTFVLQRAEDPHFRHSEEVLKSLHYMMLDFDLSKHPGRWRPSTIFVRNETTGEVVYEGPPGEMVQGLVEELINDLNGPDERSPLVAAAMAHLNLVMIHPFSDGNGRMARGLQTLVLARGGVIATPFSSIEEYLGRNTQDYYAVLSEVGAGSWSPKRDARPWIRFCLRAHYHQALTLLRRSREMQKLWDALERIVSGFDLPERTLVALVDAAHGLRIRNTTYRTGALVTDVVAARDLKLLVERKLLEKKGENRGRFYVASPLVLDVRRKTSEQRLPLPDPFAVGAEPRTTNPPLPGMSHLVPR